MTSIAARPSDEPFRESRDVRLLSDAPASVCVRCHNKGYPSGLFFANQANDHDHDVDDCRARLVENPAPLGGQDRDAVPAHSHDRERGVA